MVTNILCSYLCLFDAIIELHIMDVKTFNGFLIEKWKWILKVIKTYLICDFYLFFVVDAFITLNSKVETQIHKTIS